MLAVIRPLQQSLDGLRRGTVEFLYPPVCVRCGDSLPSSTAQQVPTHPAPPSRFCGPCYELLRCHIEQACLTCGAPVGPHLETWGCQHCRLDQFAFDRVVTLGVYDNEFKACCTRVKEPHEEPLAAGLTELLWEANEDILTEFDADVIVPVPHHWWERTSRRHLPAVTIGRVLSRRLSVPMSTHILAKRRRTPAQSSLSPSKRRLNLRNTFAIAGAARLDGLTVLITDDILTTGTTADRVARVLRDAGATQVLVAVLARGLGRMGNT